MTGIVTLGDGETSLELRPTYGGRIVRLAFGDWEVLRPVPDDENDVWFGYKGGSFPLVPFSNRIKDAKFSFDGREVRLTPHPREPGHALHGHGCFGEWSVDSADSRSAEISYTHGAGEMGWPWSYRASQRFEVNENECSVTIDVTNTSGTRMPLGLGFHPFFPFSDEVDLRFLADTEWIGPPEDFPTERRAISHDFGTPTGARLWREEKTICFDGFRGEAEICWRASGRRLRLKSDALLSHFIVHVPHGANYFCLEPVSHPTDGFNLAPTNGVDVDILALEPSHTVSTSMAFVRTE